MAHCLRATVVAGRTAGFGFSLARALHDEWKVDRIAPGHCTGELAFAILQQVFGGQDVYAGVGTTIDLS